ncbi:MAG: LTA synthase family protein, partial [Pseudomonadaceae bacterium]|nr:LTA synthase family protein [Pseudomonadaceae bacterium]
MALADTLHAKPSASPSIRPTIASHLTFTAFSALALLLMYSLLRGALLIYNRELMGDTPASTFVEAFYNGMRFDLRVVVYACIPLLLALFSVRAMAARRALRWWLTGFASLTLFLALTELDFYREFHQRLNSLVFQYFQEDPQTVMSMLWNGFPVGRYLLAWALATWLLAKLFKGLDLFTRPAQPSLLSSAAPHSLPWQWRWLALLLCLVISVVAARGHLRQGPPLRWGDAYTTDSMFANQLGLNGTLTLYTA